METSSSDDDYKEKPRPLTDSSDSDSTDSNSILVPGEPGSKSFRSKEVDQKYQKLADENEKLKKEVAEIESQRQKEIQSLQFDNKTLKKKLQEMEMRNESLVSIVLKP